MQKWSKSHHHKAIDYINANPKFAEAVDRNFPWVDDWGERQEIGSRLLLGRNGIWFPCAVGSVPGQKCYGAVELKEGTDRSWAYAAFPEDLRMTQLIGLAPTVYAGILVVSAAWEIAWYFPDRYGV
jgi:hypothetical protein